MPKTVAVRVSVVVGALLLVVGGGIYAYGAYDAATYDREAGIDVEPAPDADGTATNVSDLPRDQQALFLLAVDPGEFGGYETPDEHLQGVASEIPNRVRYDEETYEVGTSHSDAVVGALPQLLGAVVAAAGGATLLGAAAASVLRRLRRS
ncbi:hypothetical protein [Halobacterium yunchengense]|uniref:hypothetical protein n=1 Tax=Halobacterium yunchengense TaxID=3108497 RepID=UPI00300B5275